MTQVIEAKRFFKINDEDAHHFVIASDLEHVARIMRATNIEFGDSGSTFDIALLTGAVKVQELDVDRASEVMRVVLNDDRHRVPLSECDIGEWFSTEC